MLMIVCQNTTKDEALEMNAVITTFVVANRIKSLAHKKEENEI